MLGREPSPWEALRDLLSGHRDELEAALASPEREIDAFVLLGDWHEKLEDELIGLTCMVLRDARRVPVDHERPRIQMAEDAVEVRELGPLAARALA